MKPDRIIIGTDDPSIVPLLRDLYTPFTRKSDRITVMKRRSAELCKYAANAMLATRISFMNELANLCEAVGANIHAIRRGIGADSRIGSAFLFPGMGYGGSCFPKDLRALVRTATEHGESLSIVTAVDEANQRQKKILLPKIAAHFGGSGRLKGLKIAVWGLSFKAKTDDIRESPSLALIDELLPAGVKISVFDPFAVEPVRKIYGSKIDYKKNSYDCLEGADGLVIATDWPEFVNPDFGRMKQLMRHAVIFDGRNLLNRQALEQAG